MNDLLFQAWLMANGYDQQSWMPGLLRSLRARYEKSLEMIVVSGECQWPQRAYRVTQSENV
jgi:hypothetical protein